MKCGRRYCLLVLEAEFLKGDGYLGWRYASALPRVDTSHGAPEPREIMASIVDNDRGLLANLIAKHGDFLNDPSVADAAMQRELNKVDLKPIGRSPMAKYSARGRYEFLRRGVILSFGADDARDRLRSVLPSLRAPKRAPGSGVPGHVQAAFDNLNLMIDAVGQLFAREATSLSRMSKRGCQELVQLRDGRYDELSPILGHELHGTSAIRLPFVVLPAGKNVQSFFTGLQSTTKDRDRVLDPSRLRLIEDLRRTFGTARCTLYQGVFRSDEDDNAYVVVEIAQPNGALNAVAVSPWKGEHATFVVRGDCARGASWLDVLARSKSEAKDLGARRLVFTANATHGITAYDAMSQKIMCLLSCSAGEFDGGQTTFDLVAGRYMMRAKSAPQATAANSAARAARTPSPSVVSRPAVRHIPPAPVLSHRVSAPPMTSQLPAQRRERLSLWARFLQWLRAA